MIRRVTITMPHKGYFSINEDQLETRQSLQAIADDCLDDSLYCDAQWYGARARETVKTLWSSVCCTGCDNPDHELPEKVIYKWYRATSDWSVAIKQLKGKGIVFYYCAY